MPAEDKAAKERAPDTKSKKGAEAAENGKVATRTVALISLLVSMGSLAASVGTLYYNSIEQRYRAHLSYGQTRLSMTIGGTTKIAVDNQTLTFANGGNQPIAIQRLGYSVFGTRNELNERFCDEKEKSKTQQSKPLELNDRFIYLALAQGFQPFAVKAGDIEVKHYNFSGDVPTNQLTPSEGQEGNWNVVACIFVQAFSVGTGAKDINVPVAGDIVINKELANVRLFGKWEGRPFELLKGRYGFPW